MKNPEDTWKLIPLIKQLIGKGKFKPFECIGTIEENKKIVELIKKIDKNNVYLLVWTTTPWTLPANVAAAVDEEKEYGLYSNGKEGLIVLTKRANKVLDKNYKLIKTFLGKKLLF